MKAKTIMTKKIISVKEDDWVIDAAKEMKKADVGTVAVEKDDQLVGLITDRDIVLRNIASEKKPKRTKCSEIMTTDVVTATPEMEIDEVEKIMSMNQVKRVPIVEENHHVIGMISLADISQSKGKISYEAGEVLNDITEQKFK